MNSSYKVFSFTIQSAENFANDRPWQFLDQDDVKVCLSLKDSVDNEIVFPHILGKDFEILQNHIFCLLLSEEWIDLNLLS